MRPGTQRMIHPWLLSKSTSMYDSTAHAQMAYEAYVKRSGGRSLVSGDLLPEWSNLRPDVRECWIAATEALLGSEPI